MRNADIAGRWEIAFWIAFAAGFAVVWGALPAFPYNLLGYLPCVVIFPLWIRAGTRL